MIKRRLEKLRGVMKDKGIDVYIVNGSDPHKSEYPPSRWKTRSWLTGFSGSAGTVVVTLEKAGLWTDSRYFLQAEKELENSGILLFKMGLPGVPSPVEWIKALSSNTLTVSSNAFTTTLEEKRTFEKEFAGEKIKYISEEDLLDRIWDDRPDLPREKIFQLDMKYCGKDRKTKINEIRVVMNNAGVSWYLVSSLSDIAWTLNLRGNDIPFNPLFLAYLLIGKETTILFTGLEKVSSDLQALLLSERIEIRPYEFVSEYVRSLDAARIMVSPGATSVAMFSLFTEAWTVIERPDCTTEMKAVKNSIELSGIRHAMKKDGAALVRFLKWLEEKWPIPGLDEIQIAGKLTELRSLQDGFVGPSFETIAGFNEHGAIVHYSAKEGSAALLDIPGFLLLDSGGQYLDGTTDITRIIPVGGKKDTEVKKDYTLVLKGHIDLARIQFPEGTTGIQLDLLARHSLWMEGKNYLHGTGHGVGHFLTVHEGPENISPRQPSAVLKPGMVMSNEPGLYREGKYGIRIENLVTVVESEETEFGRFYKFETLTLCPLERDLIDTALLTEEQLQWVNAYHEKVYALLSPFLAEDEKIWLQKKTAVLQ